MMGKITIKSHLRTSKLGKKFKVRKHIRRLSMSTLEVTFQPGVRNALNVSLGAQGEQYIMQLLQRRGFAVKRVGHLTAGIGDLVVANTLFTEMGNQKWLVEVKTLFDREKQKDGNRIIFRKARPQINIKAHGSMENYARKIRAKPIYVFIIVNNVFDGTINKPIFKFNSQNVYFLSRKIINKEILKSKSKTNIKLGRRLLQEKFDFSLKTRLNYE